MGSHSGLAHAAGVGAPDLEQAREPSRSCAFIRRDHAVLTQVLGIEL